MKCRACKRDREFEDVPMCQDCYEAGWRVCDDCGELIEPYGLRNGVCFDCDLLIIDEPTVNKGRK